MNQTLSFKIKIRIKKVSQDSEFLKLKQKFWNVNMVAILSVAAAVNKLKSTALGGVTRISNFGFDPGRFDELTWLFSTSKQVMNILD